MADNDDTPTHTHDEKPGTAAESKDGKPDLKTTPETADKDDKDPGESAAEQQDNDEADDKDGDGKPKNRVPAKKRIPELVAQRNAAVREAEQLRKKVDRLEKAANQPVPEDATLDQVDDIRIKRTLAQSALEENKERLNEVEAEAWNKRTEAFAERAAEVADRMPGLMDKLKALPNVSDDMADFMIESDKGVEVAWYLTANPAEASKIAKLPPAKQGIELARIEARVSPATVRRNSKAPDPPSQIKGAGGGPQHRNIVEVASGDNMADYIKARKAGLGGR
jgi:hypothetical protein